jgi:hypothetical protein
MGAFCSTKPKIKFQLYLNDIAIAELVPEKQVNILDQLVSVSKRDTIKSLHIKIIYPPLKPLTQQDEH